MPEQARKFYVTTPIYYVNAKPHLGSLYSTVLADVSARWNQISGKKTFLLTGTDEHGQKVAQAAEAAGKQPREFVDSIAHTFQDAWKAYEIDYSHFIRTTDPEHAHAVQTWIKLLQDKGDIYKSVYKGYYCTSCETFVTEKDLLEGVTEEPNCLGCSRKTNYIEEESYFFKLAAYQERLLAFYRQHPDFITPSERAQEVISFVESGLRDLSISRTSTTWGIPFPGDEKHVCYVWADALNNYISAVGYANKARQDEFSFWWPADLQVLGKDIIRFHAVYWPAFLMAAGLELPRRLLVHGWIKIGDQKMSKSLGNVIDPQALLSSYGADAVRYYLTRHVAITHDAPFTIEDLEQRINADLVNDLSNLLHRMLTLAAAQQVHELSAPQQWTTDERALQELLQAVLHEMKLDMELCMYHRAYASLWKFINAVNSYFHSHEPWKVAKTDRAGFERIISATAHSLYAIGILLSPVMPQKAQELLTALGAKLEHGVDYLRLLKETPWQRVFIIQACPPLFLKIAAPAASILRQAQDERGGKQEKESMSNTSYITIDDFAKVELLVGTITAVELVPKSDKLYALTVDLGAQGVRQVCSGVRKHFTPEELLNKQGIFVANLAPRPMMGLTSQGMMLFAEDETGKLKMATVAGVVPNGSRLR
jgi:methionyl-tRNA synthetase